MRSTPCYSPCISDPISGKGKKKKAFSPWPPFDSRCSACTYCVEGTSQESTVSFALVACLRKLSYRPPSSSETWLCLIVLSCEVWRDKGQVSGFNLQYISLLFVEHRRISCPTFFHFWFVHQPRCFLIRTDPVYAPEWNREFPLKHGFLFSCYTECEVCGAAAGEWGCGPQTPTLLLSQRHCWTTESRSYRPS